MITVGRATRATLFGAALALLGCADKAKDQTAPTNADSAECDGDFDAFAPGMTKQATPGKITVDLEDAEPSPPVVRNDNVWQLLLTDADDQPLEGATVVASPYMPKHQHGSAEVVVTDQGRGEYQLSPVELIMPGVWEIPISVTPADGKPSEATFRLCIAAQ